VQLAAGRLHSLLLIYFFAKREQRNPEGATRPRSIRGLRHKSHQKLEATFAGGLY